MATICPTILASEPHDYRAQAERIAQFSLRIQIDLSDGDFAPTKTVSLDQVWWPHTMRADLHLMYKNPINHIAQIIKLNPHLVIVHAEAEGNFIELAHTLREHDIKVGVALLPQTDVETIQPALKYIDHLLIFSGDLGKFGGKANLELLPKVKIAKHLKSGIEVGWDGGINAENIRALVAGGVDVLNVGGYIQKAINPARAYATLLTALRNRDQHATKIDVRTA